MRIALVSCCSKKEKGNHKAENLYSSPLFRKQIQYAKIHSDRVFILSAKYGLLSPEDIITDYDITLNTFSKKEQQLWAYKVWQQLKDKIRNDDEIIWLAGLHYRKYLSIVIKNKQTTPLKGLSIGRQLEYLNKKLSKSEK